MNDYEFVQDDAIGYCITEPKDDELSYEKAVEEAKRILLEQQTPYNGSEEPVTREIAGRVQHVGAVQLCPAEVKPR